MIVEAETIAVRCRSRSRCPACGATGTRHYEQLPDRWYGVPGSWNLSRCDAPDCGTLFQDPSPIPEDLHLLYSRYYTHGATAAAGDVLGRGPFRRLRLAYLGLRYGYTASDALPRAAGLLMYLVPGRREHLDLTLMKLPASARGRVLDVGCGSGAILRLMKTLGWKAEGIDADDAAITAVRSAGLEAQAGIFGDAPLPGRAFDAVVSNHVIEHVPEPAAFLRECFRVLKPGGRVAITTPNVNAIGHRLLGDRWRALDPPRHLTLLAPRAFERMAREAGFEEIRTETSPRLAPAIYRESLKPECMGDTTARSAGWPLRAAASSFQILERLALLFAPAIGEEILLTARRPETS